MSDSMEETIKRLGLEWAREYGNLIEGATEDIAEFFTQVAGIAAEAALEGDEDALKLLQVAGYSMLSAHRTRLRRKNRKTVQRGIRLLVSVIQILSLGLGNAVVASTASAVASVIPNLRPQTPPLRADREK